MWHIIVMGLEARLEQKQTQQLVLTPQMKLAIHLLHLPLIELNTFLEEQITENPLLEEPGEGLGKKESDRELSVETGSGKDEIDRLIELEEQKIEVYARERYDREWEKRRKRLENITTAAPTLQEHLMMQLDTFARSGPQKTIGETIIYNIDENGYLRASIDELASDLNVTAADVEKTLSLIQTFSPAGVGARSLSECLMLQLRQRGKESSLAGEILKTHLADLKKKQFKKIAKGLGVSIDEVKNAFSEISRLGPKPGSSFGSERPRYVIPDILLHPAGNKYRIEINNEGIPRFRVSSHYKKLLKSKNTPDETRQYIKKKLNQALWLVKAVGQRNVTIRKVMECIIRIQKDFLDNGSGFIKPLTLKEVARTAGVSESTVSRVVANKYIDTPRGIFELRRFFSGELRQEGGGSRSTEDVKARIKELVQDEKPGKPLSDKAILKVLHSEGINVARRTVAKYRKQLNIPVAGQRGF